MIDLRHELSGFLLKYNGQIGYSVQPSERKKGYACQMLFLVLKKAENFGYKKVLVCCNKANAQSASFSILSAIISGTAVLVAQALEERLQIS